MNFIIPTEKTELGDLIISCGKCLKHSESPYTIILLLPYYFQRIIHCSHYNSVCCRSMLALLKMVLEYCTCLEDLPKSAPDILTKLTDLLKVWLILMLLIDMGLCTIARDYSMYVTACTLPVTILKLPD